MILIGCMLIFGGLQAVDARDEKIGQGFRELPSLENRFFDFDTRIEGKLERMETIFEEKLNSVETFYKRKLTKMENRLSESEKRQKFTEIFYKNKLAEMKNNYNNIQEKLHSTLKRNELILTKVEKRLNNIEERLDEAVHEYENKPNNIEKNLYYPNEKENSNSNENKVNDIEKALNYPNEKEKSNFKSIEKRFSSKIEHGKSDAGKRKVIAYAENTELKSNNRIINTSGVQEENVSTPEIVGHAMKRSDTEALKVNDRNSENTVCASLNRRLTPSENNRIAFTAYISSSAVTKLGGEHTIPFDQVLLNEGHAFDTVFHAFICPVNGIYMFQSAVLSTHENLIQTEIVKDGVKLVVMYAAGATGSHGYNQGFNSAIIQCNKGERVWVRVHEHYGTDLLGSRYTTFSGYLLWEI